jgi:hypothetical protein
VIGDNSKLRFGILVEGSGHGSVLNNIAGISWRGRGRPCNSQSELRLFSRELKLGPPDNEVRELLILYRRSSIEFGGYIWQNGYFGMRQTHVTEWLCNSPVKRPFFLCTCSGLVANLPSWASNRLNKESRRVDR